jgi:ubiquinone/menaquinone biosynthesis C-methylase UbiE
VTGLARNLRGWGQLVREQIEYPASVAESYERNNVKLLFRPWAKVLVERSGVRPGDRVLDVACGTGIVARTVAPIVGSQGRVVGSDLNPAMLAEAAHHVPEGFSIEWVQSNAQQLVFDDDSFDFVFCQQGLQFVPDRVAAVAEMCRVLRPGGTAVAAVWRGLEHNVIMGTSHAAISAHVSPEAASVLERGFSNELDDPDRWAELFTTAGFSSVEVDQVELTIPADDPFARMTDGLPGLPIGDQITAMDESAYQAMVADMIAAVEPWIIDGRLHAPYAINLVIAHR